MNYVPEVDEDRVADGEGESRPEENSCRIDKTLSIKICLQFKNSWAVDRGRKLGFHYKVEC